MAISNREPQTPAYQAIGQTQVAQPAQASVQGWDKFLQDISGPGMTNTLLTLGLGLTGPLAPGQTEANKALEAITGAAGNYRALQTQEKHEGRAERQVKAQERQTDIAAERNVITKDQGEETLRQGREGLENERLRTQAYIRAIEQQAKALAAAGQMTPDKALQYATSAVNEQEKTITSRLAEMDPQDPDYAATYKMWMEFGQRKGEYINNLARQFMIPPVAPAPISDPFAFQEMIRSDQRYLSDPAGYEKMLQETTGDKYRPRTGGFTGGPMHGGGAETPATPPESAPAAPKQPSVTEATAAKPATVDKAKRLEEKIDKLKVKLGKDKELKEPGIGGIGARAIKEGRAPLGMAEKKRLQRKLEVLEKELTKLRGEK